MRERCEDKANKIGASGPQILDVSHSSKKNNYKVFYGKLNCQQFLWDAFFDLLMGNFGRVEPVSECTFPYLKQESFQLSTSTPTPREMNMCTH